jgi:hypothetical protein
MPTGRSGPQQRLANPHSHGFDAAFDDALAKRKRPPKARSYTPTGPVEVTFEVSLKYSDNPGWEVNRYIVHIRD